MSVCPSPPGLVPGQQRLPDPGSLQPLLHPDPPRLRDEEASAPEQRGQRAGSASGSAGPRSLHTVVPKGRAGVSVKWVLPTVVGTDHGQSGCGASPRWGQSREAAGVSATCHHVGERQDGLPTASRLPPPATGTLQGVHWTATGCPVSWASPLTWPLAQGFFLSLQAKVEMLDNLLDIEVAYSLLRGGSDDSSKDPIDVNYEKLKTDIKVTGRTLSEASSALTQVRGPQTSLCAGSPGELPSTGGWATRPPCRRVPALTLESCGPFPLQLSTWCKAGFQPRPRLGFEGPDRWSLPYPGGAVFGALNELRYPFQK